MFVTDESDKTICDVVRTYAETTPQAPALVQDGKEPLTYAGLVEIMDKLQERFNSAGFGRGDRIGTVGPNGSAMAALITGIWGCATAVPMNPALTVGEFFIYLRDLKVQALAVFSGFDTPARTAAQELGLSILEVELLDDRIAGMIHVRPSALIAETTEPGPAQSHDIASVLTTSGTTSHSKIVPVTHQQLTIKDRRYVEALQLTQYDRCLNLMPLFHVHGLYCALGATLFSGGSLVTLPEFSEDGFFYSLETLAPTWYTGSYTFHHCICAAAPRHAAEIEKSHLRFTRSASGYLDPRIADELERIFRAPVITFYGSTETAPVCCTPMPPAVRKRGAVGPSLGSKLAIMDPDNRFMKAGECGEVVVNASDNFSGYENDPAANAEAMFDEWFRSGDEGFIDEDGYLTITGRLKDAINRGGEKITPSEIDEALLSHPDVSMALAFPMPHATLGHEVAAAVVAEPGAVLTDEMLSSYLRGRLAPFKIPRKFVIVGEIPKGPTGKFQRLKLAEAFDLTAAPSEARSEIADERLPSPLEGELKHIWAHVLGLENLGLNEDFFLLGGDSLQAVDLFLRVEKQLGRRLPRSILFEAGTIAKMAQRIEQLVPSSCLVPIQPKGEKPPFFCIHDANGQILNYRDLARHLGDAQPFYGIQCRGLDGEEEPFTRIEDMAEYYVQEIKKIQPVGPYYLGGYSLGGHIAYVMARLIRAAGEEVALLALIDSYSNVGQRRVGFRDWLAHHRQRLATLPTRGIPAYLWLRLTNFLGMVCSAISTRAFSIAWRIFESRSKAVPRFLRRPVAANNVIRRDFRSGRYQPQPYDGDAVLFKADRYAWVHDDQHDGWFDLVKGNLEVRPISGRHYDIVREPHVRKLASELTEVIQRAQMLQSSHKMRAKNEVTEIR